MRELFHIPVQEVYPPLGTILEGQGIPRWAQPGERIRELARDALMLYAEKAMPTGLVMEIAKEEFRQVFRGEELNEDASPVGPIAEASDHLALFAVTIGEPLCEEIPRRFMQNDFALGSMLDSVASAGTEMTAEAVENLHRKHLQTAGRLDEQQRTLRFSPGYCGWHISAQRKLFRSLEPANIGITLNESYLMQPLKSISGVIIAGKKEIFWFDDTFSFCRDCAAHTCRDRINALFEQ